MNVQTLSINLLATEAEIDSLTHLHFNSWIGLRRANSNPSAYPILWLIHSFHPLNLKAETHPMKIGAAARTSLY